MIKRCPKCGAENEIGEITSSTECPACGIIFSKYNKPVEKKQAQLEAERKAAEEAEQKKRLEAEGKKHKKDEKKRNRKLILQKSFEFFRKGDKTGKQISKNRLVNPIIVVSVIVALAVSFVGYKIYLNIEKQYAEKEFSNFVENISGKMIQLAIDSENIVDEINRSWREAIFSDYNKRDFNVAILEVMLERSDEISSIKKLSEEISKNIKDMKPPVGKEEEYKRLKELYLLFNKYANMAISPSGSLQTYSQQNSELSVEIKSAIKELEMMK